MPDARGVLTAQPGEGRAAPRVDYPIFDLIRGICALVVVARHSAPLWGTKAQRGYLAVDAFFILSGFVIAHAYEAKLVARAMGFAQFARIRLIRLYPMYLVGLVVGLDVNPRTAWFAVFELGIPSFILGALVGLAGGAIAYGISRLAGRARTSTSETNSP